MSSNLENDGLIGLQNAMVINDDNYAKNPYDDVGIPPLLPRRKSSRRIVSEDIDLAATMQSSSPGDLRVNITDGSLLITTRRSSPLSRLGGKDGSSPSGSLLVSSDTDSDTADSFAATFAPECDNNGDDDDDDIGLVIAESSSMINLDAHLTHAEVMFAGTRPAVLSMAAVSSSTQLPWDNNDEDDDDIDTDINDDDDNYDDDDSDDEDVCDFDLNDIEGMSEYELMRLQRVHRNNARLASLGLLGGMTSNASPSANRTNRKKRVVTQGDYVRRV